MSERVRRIKKAPLRIAKRIKIFIGVALGLILIWVGVWLVRYYFNNPGVITSGLKNPGISDRNLAAAICRGGNCFWLNQEGIAYNQSGRIAGNIVLSIEDKSARDLKLGGVLMDKNIVAELLFLRTRILEDLGLGLRAGETNDLSSGDFDFVTGEGWQLRLSTAENAYKTLETLKQSLTEIKKIAPTVGLEYVDLRVPNKVYYKFK